MPQLSNFYGIIIFMNFQDHAPAHFHAVEKIAPLK
jgi:hypothetical protein